MSSRNLILFATWIILLSSSCNSDPEPVTYLERATETNIESGSIFSPEKHAELIRTSDSLSKVAEAELPLACSYEYGEDINFNKYVTITLKNNTKKVINSVQLNIEYSSFQSGLGNDVNQQLSKIITINPGKSKTIRHNIEYNIDHIDVVKYSSNGKVEFNGLQALVKENRRKLDKQFPPHN
jgi:hypothetical protein